MHLRRKRSDHNDEGQDVHCRQWRFSAPMMGSVSLTLDDDDHETDKELLGHTNRKRCHTCYNRSDSLHPRARHLLFNVTLVEDSPSELSLGRLCDELFHSYSWQPKRNDQTNEKGGELLDTASNISSSLWRWHSHQELHLWIQFQTITPLQREALCPGKKSRTQRYTCSRLSRKK